MNRLIVNFVRSKCSAWGNGKSNGNNNAKKDDDGWDDDPAPATNSKRKTETTDDWNDDAPQAKSARYGKYLFNGPLFSSL